jgi:hypothetical protein
LLTIGGVLLAVIAGLSGWAWTRIEAHEGRIIRIETQFDSCSETLKEIKSDIKEIKQSLGKKP